ncbi:MAG: BatA domain-containing protein [Phycisphaerales bacterium]
MNLLAPGFLIAGVLATAVPIAIFLLWRQRRMPVPFAAMRFLFEAERKHHRRLRTERLIMLALRCLAVIALGAALARPLLERAGLLPGSQRVMLIVIDDSMTAGLVDASGTTVLDGHVATAEQLLDEAGPGDRIGVIRTSRGGEDLLPPSADVASVRTWLRGLAPRPVRSDIPSAMRQLSDAAMRAKAGGGEPAAFLLSEFRAGSADLEDALPDLALPASTALLASQPATDLRANVVVGGVDPIRAVILPGAADGSGQITIRLERHGDLSAGTSRVRIDGEDLPVIEPRTVTWRPGQAEASLDVLLPVTGLDARSLAVSIAVDEDQLPIDDRRAIVLEVRESLRIGLVDRGGFGTDRAIDRLTSGQWYARALRPGGGGQLEVVGLEPAALVPADLRTIDALIVPRPDLLREEGWSAIGEWTQRGGLLLVSPPEELTVHQWADDFLATFNLDWRIDRTAQELAEAVPLATPRGVPSVFTMLAGELEDLVRPVLTTRRLDIEVDGSAEALLTMEDGRPLMLTGWTNADSPAVATIAGSGPAGAGAGSGSGSGAGPSDANPNADPSANPNLTTPSGRGLIALLSTAPSLEWTNLPTKPLMVPLVQEFVREGLGQVRRDAVIRTGDRPTLARFPAADQLITPNDATLAITSDGRPADPLPAPGLYRVRDAAGTELGTFAAVIDPAGSRTETQAADAVQSWLARSGAWTTFDADNPAAALRRSGAATGLATAILLILLLLLVAETLLGRLFSRASRNASGDRASSAGGRGRGDGSILPTLNLQTVGGGGAGGGRGSGIGSGRGSGRGPGGGRR